MNNKHTVTFNDVVNESEGLFTNPWPFSFFDPNGIETVVEVDYYDVPKIAKLFSDCLSKNGIPNRIYEKTHNKGIG